MYFVNGVFVSVLVCMCACVESNLLMKKKTFWYLNISKQYAADTKTKKKNWKEKKMRDNLGIDPWRNGISVINWHQRR